MCLVRTDYSIVKRILANTAKQPLILAGGTEQQRQWEPVSSQHTGPKSCSTIFLSALNIPSSVLILDTRNGISTSLKIVKQSYECVKNIKRLTTFCSLIRMLNFFFNSSDNLIGFLLEQNIVTRAHIVAKNRGWKGSEFIGRPSPLLFQALSA